MTSRGKDSVVVERLFSLLLGSFPFPGTTSRFGADR